MEMEEGTQWRRRRWRGFGGKDAPSQPFPCWSSLDVVNGRSTSITEWKALVSVTVSCSYPGLMIFYLQIHSSISYLTLNSPGLPRC